jgi:hypothetical protein
MTAVKLNEKRFLTIEEPDERKRIVGQRLMEQYKQAGISGVLQDTVLFEQWQAENAPA